MVDVHPTSVSIEKTCLRVRLFALGTIDIVEEVSLLKPMSLLCLKPGKYLELGPHIPQSEEK